MVGVGKIPDIYAGRGFTREVKTVDNRDGLEKTLSLMQEPFSGLVFTNLVDFDAKYGHRRDPEGYARALKEVDDFLPRLLEALGPEDHLFLVSDHGNDPTFFGTDHTREYGMLLWVGPGVEGDLGTRESFADLGATWAKLLGFPGRALEKASFRPCPSPGATSWTSSWWRSSFTPSTASSPAPGP